MRQYGLRWLVALFLAVGLGCTPPPSAQAQVSPVTISAPNRTDMVYDSARQILYITNGSSVLRYSISLQSFLDPIQLGGALVGIDISPDNKRLAVADETAMHLNVVELTSSAIKEIEIKPGLNEVGLYDLAFGSDGSVYASAALPPGWSGWVWLRKIDPTGSEGAKVIGREQVTNYTLLRASADRNVIGFSQGDISDGRWGTIDVNHGKVTFLDGSSAGTSWFNFDIATAMHGSQFALPTYGGLFIYDNSYTKIYTLGQYATTVYDGVAYSPKTGHLFATLANSDEIQEFDPKTFQQLAVYHMGVTFPNNGNGEFSSGILRFSPDGSLLFVSTPGGIEYQQLF